MTSTGEPDRWAPSVKGWSRFLSPFRPDRDDVSIVERVARELASDAPLQVVTLGLTPEVIGCNWPEATSLKAFDSSHEALRRLWPVTGAPAGFEARQASWLDLPVERGSADLVTADGSLVCVSYPAQIERVLEEVRRVLRPGGMFVARTFLRPDDPETLDAILADLEAGRIGNPYVLKIRVDAVLHHDGFAGFSMLEKSNLWQELFPDPAAVAARFGWAPETMAIPGDYSIADLRFTYPTLGELRGFLAQGFEELECAFASYELAERCPSLVLRKK